MNEEFNNHENNENVNILPKNKIKKYITVQRIKSKSKKLSIFSEKDLNHIYTEQINQINKNFIKRKKTFSNFTNALKDKNNTKNKNINKNSPLFIYLNELNNNYSTINSKNKTNKQNYSIHHTNSYFSPKAKPKIKINKKINSSNNKLKSKSKIKNDKVLKTFNSNNILNHSKTIIKSNNTNINNKIILQKITKDTIFQKENINPNCYNTISTNINQEFYKAKKLNINFTKNKRNKNFEKDNNTKANTNESMNTIIIKKNNSALLTFGNNDSLNDSFSKANNANKNYLLILKQENESLKNELMKTKEKVDILQNKIQNLIEENEPYSNNRPNFLSNIKNNDKCDKIETNINDKIKSKSKNKNNNMIKYNNKSTLKISKSQKNFKVINRNKKLDDKKFIKKINSLKSKRMNNTSSNFYKIRK